MAARIDFDSAVRKYRKACDTCDRAWDAYRKARERLAKKRGTFSAEQGFIDAGQAVGRAAANLDARKTELRSACFQMATDELTSSARARLPFKAPTPEEKRLRMEEIVTSVIHGRIAG